MHEYSLARLSQGYKGENSTTEFNELGCGPQMSMLALAFHQSGPSRAGYIVTRILLKDPEVISALASRKTVRQVENRG